MKILLIMESAFPGIGWACAREFTRLGHEVVTVDNKRNHLPGRAATVWEYGKAAQRLRLSRLNDLLTNKEIRQVATAFDPELILLSKGENVYAGTIAYLREHTSAVLINWNLDNPFHPANTSMAHLRSMPLLDCYGTFAHHLIPALYNVGCPRVEYWPCYFYPDLHSPDGDLTQGDRDRYRCDVAFAGLWSPEREMILTEIADYQLAIWGGNWASLSESSPLRKYWQGRHAVGEEYVKVIKGARSVINILNMQGRGASNLRTFEVTGIGRLLLTEYSDEQAHRLFRDGEEIVSYRDAEDLRRKLEYYWAHPAEADQIAARGQARTLSEHTLAHRLDRILAVAAEIRPKRCIRR